jgi:excisionase family DNA binding protein
VAGSEARADALWVDANERCRCAGEGGAPMSDSLLTADDVAFLLSVPRSWVYEQSRLGRIPTVTLGRYRRYRREAIEEWVRDVEQRHTRSAVRQPAPH